MVALYWVQLEDNGTIRARTVEAFLVVRVGSSHVGTVSPISRLIESDGTSSSHLHRRTVLYFHDTVIVKWRPHFSDTSSPLVHLCSPDSADVYTGQSSQSVAIGVHCMYDIKPTPNHLCNVSLV